MDQLTFSKSNHTHFPQVNPYANKYETPKYNHNELSDEDHRGVAKTDGRYSRSIYNFREAGERVSAAIRDKAERAAAAAEYAANQAMFEAANKARRAINERRMNDDYNKQEKNSRKSSWWNPFS